MSSTPNLFHVYEQTAMQYLSALVTVKTRFAKFSGACESTFVF